MCLSAYGVYVFILEFECTFVLCIYVYAFVRICTLYIHMCNEVNASVVSIHMYVLNEGVVY